MQLRLVFTDREFAIGTWGIITTIYTTNNRNFTRILIISIITSVTARKEGIIASVGKFYADTMVPLIDDMSCIGIASGVKTIFSR